MRPKLAGVSHSRGCWRFAAHERRPSRRRRNPGTRPLTDEASAKSSRLECRRFSLKGNVRGRGAPLLPASFLIFHNQSPSRRSPIAIVGRIRPDRRHEPHRRIDPGIARCRWRLHRCMPPNGDIGRSFSFFQFLKLFAELFFLVVFAVASWLSIQGDSRSEFGMFQFAVISFPSSRNDDEPGFFVIVEDFPDPPWHS